jgi:hypothetical protein
MTFTETVDFSDGTAGLFQPPASGTWTAANGRYAGTAASGTPAVALVDLVSSPASAIELSVTFATTGEGGLIFDRYDADNFKFVTVSQGKIVLGHHTSKGWFVDATYNNTAVQAGVDRTLGLTLKGSSVSVTYNGGLVLSHIFNALVTDGNFGLMSRTGTTSFDAVTVQSDDPGLSSVTVSSQSTVPSVWGQSSAVSGASFPEFTLSGFEARRKSRSNGTACAPRSVCCGART